MKVHKNGPINVLQKITIGTGAVLGHISPGTLNKTKLRRLRLNLKNTPNVDLNGINLSSFFHPR
jgi:hypothetical protein